MQIPDAECVVQTPLLTNLTNGLKQGPGNTERIGNRINVTSIGFKWYLTAFDDTYDYNVGGPGMQSRFIYKYWIVMDQQTNGALFDPDAFLENQAKPNILSFNNLENSERYRTLKSGLVKVPIVVSTTGAAAWKASFSDMQEMYLKFKKPVPIKYDGATGQIAEIKSNNIYLLLCWNKGLFFTDPAQTLSITVSSRVRYVDP